MSEKVTVISKSRSTILLTVPHMHLRKEWNKKGAKVLIDKEILEEAMYDPGVEYLFANGLLYIEDMQTKIDLGLEPAGATEPENIIILSDEEKELYMSSKKQGWELEKVLESLTYEGKKEFCDFVVENEIFDSKKAEIIKKVCGFDVLKAIQSKRANAEGEEQ